MKLINGIKRDESMMLQTVARTGAILFTLLALTGCGGGGGGGSGSNITTWTVTATAGANGTITPSVTTVNDGATATFTIAANSGYAIASVTGCGGSLSGTTYTTGAITGNCTVTATFGTSYSVGGNVTGLAWGYGVVLQNNGGDSLAVMANEPFTFPAGVAVGNNYSVTVSQQPATMKCTVSNGTGTVSGADISNIEVNCKDRVQALYPDNGANWNDYVKNDGANVWSATGSACDGSEEGGYSACIHGGERRMIAVSGVASCLGLSATDALDAFDWRCDESQGYIRFVSGKLKHDKRLADLIDFMVPGWKENTVTVSKDGVLFATSASTQWWNNPLVIDNDGMSEAEMSATGTLYLVTDSVQGKYEIGADKIALVINPGVALRGLGDATSVVSSAGRKFLWVEGSLNAHQDKFALNLTSLGFSVLRNIEVTNASERGIYLGTSRNNSLTRITASNNRGGIYLASSPNNIITGFTAVNGFSGIVIDHSNDNVTNGVTVANNSQMGLFPHYSNNNLVVSATLANHGSAGLYVYSSSNGTFADVASAHNDTGIYLDLSSNNTFTGILKLGNNSAHSCHVPTGTNPGLVNLTCENSGTSNAALTNGITLETSFVGKVTADDPVNVTETNGAANYPDDPATFDWTSFSNEFRGWGKNSGLFPSADNRGQWLTGVGRIWDWSAANSDTVIKEVLSLPTGNDTITHTWSNGTTTTFLRHAIELDGDSDGLCESNETCLYAANMGAYQGHGRLLGGTFSDGTITGVKLLQYEYNGR